MLAQAFWAPAKSCSRAVPALFLFSKPGQKRQANPCSSPLGHILRNIKWGGHSLGSTQQALGDSPSKTHTLLSYTKHIDHLSAPFLFLLLLVKREEPTSASHQDGSGSPSPPHCFPANLLLVPPPTSSAPPRAGCSCSWLPDRFSGNNCSLGLEWGILNKMLIFLFVYVKDEDFHTEDRNNFCLPS